MAKLTQDEIKWILSIDTKGANREIAVTTSEINKLAQENRVMSKDMKAAEKQIRETERAMEKLTKAGKEDSEAFRELKATRDSARTDIDDYTRRIGENNRAIDENKKKITELEKGLSLNEMTMKQLRARAAELTTQLNSTSLAANPKAYKDLQKDLTAVENRMEFVGRQGRGLIAQFTGMNHPVGTAAKAVVGFGQALKALAANPIGIIIMIIAGAFTALKKAINSSEEASNKFQQIMAPVKLVMDGLLFVLQKVVVGFLDLTKAILDWASKAAEKIPFIGNKMKELNDKAQEAIELEKEKQQLRVRERESIVSNAEKERDIAELRNKAKQRDIYTNEQIIGFLDEAIQLEREIAEEKIEQAKISLRLLETESARTQNTEEMSRKIAEQTALVTQLETEFLTKTRRMESERFSRIDEMRREDEAAAKEAVEKRIEREEFALQKELTLLKQQLVEKEITDAEHDRLVEQKTLESLNKRLEIQGIEEKKRAEIEQHILDYKVKALEQEKQFAKEREAITAEFQKAVMTENERELQSIRDKHTARLKDLQEHLEKELITEVEFNEYRTIVLEEQAKELEEKQNVQREMEAARKLESRNVEFEQEKMQLMEKYASGLMSKQAYEEAILNLEQEYALKSLDIENLSSEQKKATREKLLNFMISKQETETKKQEAEQKKRVELYSKFGEEIGTLMSGVISGNEDVVKSSLKAVLNMALDALEAQITMAIASATAQSFAQADSVASFGASGAARAAILTALIKAAFAGVKGIVNSSLSGSGKSGSNNSSPSTSTGARIITGRQSGGFVDVTRQQDGKYFRALMKPKKRGFVDRPTVIVGDGPAGKSREWVASNDALENPTVAPVIKLLNEAQQAGTIRTIDLNHLMRTRMAGFAQGGFLYDNPLADAMRKSGSTDPSLYREKDGSEYMELIRETKDLLSGLKREGIPSYMIFSEYQKKKDLLEKSQNIGSK